MSFNRSVLPGSNFRDRSTSLSCFCVFFKALSACDRADESLVVSPPISIVMPLIFPPDIPPEKILFVPYLLYSYNILHVSDIKVTRKEIFI